MSYSSADPQRALVHRVASSFAPQTTRLSSLFDGLQKGQLPRAGGNAPAKKAVKKPAGGRPGQQQQQQRGGVGGSGRGGQATNSL